MTKAERAYRRAKHKFDAIIALPATHPIWTDEKFWTTEWPAICDSLQSAVEAYLKE